MRHFLSPLDMSVEELQALLAKLNQEYEEMKALGLTLDMSRGTLYLFPKFFLDGIP